MTHSIFLPTHPCSNIACVFHSTFHGTKHVRGKYQSPEQLETTCSSGTKGGALSLTNSNCGEIKLASSGTNTSFPPFSLISYSHTSSFLACTLPYSMILSFASTHHDHYLILLMALEGKEVPMTTSDLVPLSFPLML